MEKERFLLGTPPNAYTVRTHPTSSGVSPMKDQRADAPPFQDGTATVVHSVAEDHQMHVVGIGSLRVQIDKDGSCWYAQGLEIDYLAMGHTEAQARKHFEDGLAATVHEHVRIHGHIEHLLTPAPPEVWKEVMQARRYSQVSVHYTPAQNLNLPFGKIDYIATTGEGQDAAGQRDSA